MNNDVNYQSIPDPLEWDKRIAHFGIQHLQTENGTEFSFLHAGGYLVSNYRTARIQNNQEIIIKSLATHHIKA